VAPITSIRGLLPAIAAAEELACQYYRRSEILEAQFKDDRTVVTAADKAVETLLRQAIADCFSDVNVLGEEGGTTFDPRRPYTFTVDPIDGTAAFVSGTPGWAICVGVLDRTLQPVAGIVSAPRWDSLFVADIDPQSPATHNGMPLPAVQTAAPVPIDDNTTILIDSKLLRTHQLHDFPGKCRCFGSTALHVCLVAQQTGFALSHACPVYVWDIAAAHAIVQRVGLTVQYLDGRPLVYEALLPAQPTLGHIAAGHPTVLAAICPTIVPV
jgi:fructose-1,6-bisphosphatase/inositol monophosphatase family enzyme